MSMKTVFLTLCVALAFSMTGCGRSKPPSSKAATAEAVTAEDAAAAPSKAPAPQTASAPASPPPGVVPPPAQPMAFGPLPPGRDPAGDASIQKQRDDRAKRLGAVQHDGEQKGVQSQAQPEGNDGQ